MKRHLPVLVATLLIFSDVSATTCRSQTAAMAGSRTGYSRDEGAATRVEQKESQSSDAVGRCVSGITTINVMPTFPSLSDIFNSVIERACTVAIDRLRDVPIPGTPGGAGTGDLPGLPAWPSLPGSSSPTPSPGDPGGAIPIVPTTPSTTLGTTASDLWRAIWH
ncbi:hypothetical protein [Rugamonas apoptosis]|uniref:Secreted protein n=1 Tax=Rugamonas apoptosis TaxID=2758570 RepID=A0A7W2FFA1_9BURK|nr:hypothetical protein [Rugamonas apoptosis]MBA5690534.1 hypothetical protein [Rugamonas apoptosis]